MTEEHVIISVTREEIEDYLYVLGGGLEGGLSDDDIEEIANTIRNRFENSDFYYEAIQDVLGERLKEN